MARKDAFACLQCHSYGGHINLPRYNRDPYRRYLENKLRENFDLTGVPISIHFRAKND